MNELLFYLQQLLLPLWLMWPVWCAFVVLYVAIRFSKWALYAVWIKRLVMVLVVVVTGIRLLLLVVFPYADRETQIPLDNSTQNLPLYVVSRSGDLSVSHEQSASNFRYTSYDVKNGYIFTQADYIDAEGGEETKIPSLYLRGSEAPSFLTRFWSSKHLFIPTAFSESETFYLLDSKVSIDMRNSLVKTFNVGVYFSSVKLYLPSSGTHVVDVFGGNKASGKIYFSTKKGLFM